MVDHRQFQQFAALRLSFHAATEIEVRRSVSAIYYGLFHRLAASGSAAFREGGMEVCGQAARAYSHTTMLDVCKAFSRLPKDPLPSPLDRLIQRKPDERLISIAKTFVVLQDARHVADYDVTGIILQSDALYLLQQAEQAHWFLDQIGAESETVVFLTALLLHDRWRRRG